MAVGAYAAVSLCCEYIHTASPLFKTEGFLTSCVYLNVYEYIHPTEYSPICDIMSITLFLIIPVNYVSY